MAGSAWLSQLLKGYPDPEVRLSRLWSWLVVVEVCVRFLLPREWGAFRTPVRFLPSTSLSGFLRVGVLLGRIDYGWWCMAVLNCQGIVLSRGSVSQGCGDGWW